MGVHLGGQVELGVGRIAIGVTPVAIGEAFHLDLSEDGGELAAMARLHRPMVDTLGADDLLGTSFTKGTQVELSLEHLAQQFPAAAVELVLQLTVAERGGLAALEPSHRSSKDSRAVANTSPDALTGVRLWPAPCPGGGCAAWQDPPPPLGRAPPWPPRSGPGRPPPRLPPWQKG